MGPRILNLWPQWSSQWCRVKIFWHDASKKNLKETELSWINANKQSFFITKRCYRLGPFWDVNNQHVHKRPEKVLWWHRNLPFGEGYVGQVRSDWASSAPFSDEGCPQIGYIRKSTPDMSRQLVIPCTQHSRSHNGTLCLVLATLLCERCQVQWRPPRWSGAGA